MPKRKSNGVEWKGRKFREKAARFRFGAREGKEKSWREGRGTPHKEGKGRTAQGMIGVEEGDDGCARGGEAGRQEGSDL